MLAFFSFIDCKEESPIFNLLNNLAKTDAAISSLCRKDMLAYIKGLSLMSPSPWAWKSKYKQNYNHH